jgi:hypothetical protein
VVLPEKERRQRAAPHVYQYPPRSPAYLGVRGSQKGPQQAAAHAQGRPVVTARGHDRGAPPTDIFQSSDLAALTTGDQDVVVSEAKLSRLLL